MCQSGARQQERLPCLHTSRRARSVWDMRAERIVRTLETGKAVTSLEVQRDGSFLATADGSEVRARTCLRAPAQTPARHGRIGAAVALVSRLRPLRVREQHRPAVGLILTPGGLEANRLAASFLTKRLSLHMQREAEGGHGGCASGVRLAAAGASSQLSTLPPVY